MAELGRTLARAASVMIVTHARPIVGVISCRRAVAGEPAQVVIERYLNAVMRYAGCAAMLVPSLPELMQAGEVADRFDGLLLTGSPSNIAPARFGTVDDPGEGPFDDVRDAMALGMIEAMIDRARPVLGICRGHQELNVALGGTLRRGLADIGRDLSHHADHGVTLEAMFGHAHEVTLTSGGVLARELGCERLVVNSVHFQGIERLASGLAIEARADDGLIEAFSAELNGAPLLGVQWHPEWQTHREPTSAAIFEIFGRALRGERGTFVEHDPS